jgi:CsoR family transcriptional regulator, copper-sensing transcriptional repressor
MDEHGSHDHRGYTDDKDAYLKRLRRVEGQVRGLQRLIEEDRYCIDVLTQISATTRALQGVALALMDDHLRHCVAEAASDPQELDRKLDEASAVLKRMVTS